MGHAAMQSRRIAKVLAYARPSAKLIWAQRVELVPVVKRAVLLSRRSRVFYSWLIQTRRRQSKEQKEVM